MLTEQNQRVARARALSSLGIAWYCRGEHDRAETFYRESLQILESESHKAGMARVIGSLGLIALQVREDFETARTMFEQALALASELEIPSLEALYLGNLGEVWFAKGEIDRAVDFADRSLSAFRQLGNESFIADQLKLLSKYAIERDQVDVAREHLREALRMFLELDQRIEIAECLSIGARIARSIGEFDTAAKLLGHGKPLLEDGHRFITRIDRAAMEALREDISREVGERFSELEAAGRALTRAQAIGLT